MKNGFGSTGESLKNVTDDSDRQLLGTCAEGVKDQHITKWRLFLGMSKGWGTLGKISPSKNFSENIRWI